MTTPSRAVRRIATTALAWLLGLATPAAALADAPARTDWGATAGPAASAFRTATSDRRGHPVLPPRQPTAVGYGGAVSTVDPVASRAALQVLEAGGNATDAAVAAAAMLGVTEPYSAGIGGGGYFVHYSARTGRVQTIDGRETAPAAMPNDAFIDPATGAPYRLTPELVTSGVSVGVPGTPATWTRALDRWGSRPLWRVLAPAIRVAHRGFVVDATFRQQTLDNKLRFEAFTSTRELFLPGGDAPAVGSVLRNPDLARTYRLLARTDARALYRAPLAEEIADAAQDPPVHPDTTLPVPPGYLEASDLEEYRVLDQPPTRIRYRGYEVFGMAPSSSGGSTVGEALNILERFDLPRLDDVEALHHYLEAGALAFADRGLYVGDPAFVDVPLEDLCPTGSPPSGPASSTPTPRCPSRSRPAT
jgi:gamma-glutamyltranspeptidase/glutathione hydrolase